MKYAEEIAKILALAEEGGFQRGWQAARDALSAPMPKVKIGGSVAVAPTKKKLGKTKKPRKTAGATTGGTVEARVLACIDTNPGKTGAGIIRLLGEVNPRTVRTMLRRLKQKGDIEKSGEGWFTKLK